MAEWLVLDNLCKAYGELRVVDGLTLSVPQGGFYSLLGPSGCGKTTTLRMIAGFDEPDAGEVRLNGKRLNGLKPYERPVTTVFQNYALFPHMTALENVSFGLRRRGDAAAEEKARRALEMVRLGGKTGRRPSQLSGGEKQRTALARALVMEPDLLLLDEPLSALDPALRKQMRLELKQLQAEIGITFLFITHDREEALALSDSIAVMHAGKVQQAGKPEEIYLRPATKFVAEFLGAVNWVNTAGIRPERLRLGRERPVDSAGVLEAKVERTVFLGDCFQVQLRGGAGEQWTAQIAHSEMTWRAGETVYAWWFGEDEMRVMG
jgi:spermidine/putrescine transport system ATP-binding protein